MRATGYFRFLPPALAALALAACGGAEEERTLETDTTDLSGGELIVSEEDPDAVPVNTPDTPMVPVPQNEGVPQDEGAAPAE